MAMIGSADLHRDVLRLVPLVAWEAGKISDAFAVRHDLHRTDADALSVLMAADADGRPVTTGALGAELGLTSGATTFAVNRLERAGLVRRTRDRDDGRRVFLSLSAPGRDLAARFYAPVRDWSLGVLAKFSDAELETVRRFLGETVNAMEACRSAFEAPERGAEGGEGFRAS